MIFLPDLISFLTEEAALEEDLELALETAEALEPEMVLKEATEVVPEAVMKAESMVPEEI